MAVRYGYLFDSVLSDKKSKTFKPSTSNVPFKRELRLFFYHLKTLSARENSVRRRLIVSKRRKTPRCTRTRRVRVIFEGRLRVHVNRLSFVNRFGARVEGRVLLIASCAGQGLWFRPRILRRAFRFVRAPCANNNRTKAPGTYRRQWNEHSISVERDAHVCVANIGNFKAVSFERTWTCEIDRDVFRSRPPTHFMRCPRRMECNTKLFERIVPLVCVRTQE